jgi:hypothetical protein
LIVVNHMGCNLFALARSIGIWRKACRIAPGGVPSEAMMRCCLFFAADRPSKEE